MVKRVGPLDLRGRYFVTETTIGTRVIASDKIHQISLNSVWQTPDGVAWAVGTDLGELTGIIVRSDSSISNEWKVDLLGTEAAKSRLEDLWFNDQGTKGWAVGHHGEILRYEKRDGWKREPISETLTGTTLNAVWMNQNGTIGWAVGGKEGGFGTIANATIVSFSQQKGWQQYSVNGPIANTVLWGCQVRQIRVPRLGRRISSGQQRTSCWRCGCLYSGRQVAVGQSS